MATNTVNMIYIGNLPIIDTDESNWDTDNAAALQGTYDTSVMELVAITQNDVDNDGAIMDDEANMGDTVSYTTSNGSYSGQQDATVRYNAIVSETDNSQTTLQLGVVQMPNGDTFLFDYSGGTSLDFRDISSVQLISPDKTDFAGHQADYSVENTTVCFCSGTWIETDKGPARIETLRPGDKVMTADHGAQVLRWIGGRRLERPGKHAPIMIAPGALADGVPRRTLAVSPQHRMLVRSPIVVRMFEVEEILLPAKRLLDHPGVTQAPATRPVHYWHLLFDRHEVVNANGAWAESLYLGPEAVKSIGESAVTEIVEIFGVPSLMDLCQLMGTHSRPVPEAKRQKRLVQRQIANSRAWQDGAGPPHQPSTRPPSYRSPSRPECS
ncbi:Hint domain-containing protein [Rhodobacteraceae bacterium N5(2021)]|uniref:Hint domain-containing protein n=1 Tax=Gymnodinialimonas phycosphaerae TaxID=2841589 RepID=A0A975YH56_9RHOB|nr:Hint domain-containing protein [Gymnodinialimonas phycosphaerae]MBY4892310.1 Hint domain-containing protein [Gymnodinialimonas phycosphaerae]